MASYAIMRSEKRTRSAVSGLQYEANRSADDGRVFARSDIDETRTGRNIFLRRSDDWGRTITDIIGQAGVKERKNSVVMIDTLYTASPAWFASHTPAEALQFFQDCLVFHEKTLGTAFNAVIHLDESSPHMHVVSVPIVEDENGSHLSARTLMGNRSDYRSRQDDFFESVGVRYGMDRGIPNDREHRRRHKEKVEWLKEQHAEAQKALKLTETRLQDMERHYKDVEYKTEVLERVLEEGIEVLEDDEYDTFDAYLESFEDKRILNDLHDYLSDEEFNSVMNTVEGRKRQSHSHSIEDLCR